MDLVKVLQDFQARKGVNLEKGGFPIGTIRKFDGVDFRKIADTGGKADWIRVDTPHGDKVHMDINKFNQFLSMLSFGDQDFEKRYIKKRSDFITNLGKIYHPNDVEVLLEKTKNPTAKVKPVHGRVFLEDGEGKPIIPDHIKGHLQATGLKVVSSDLKTYPQPPKDPKEGVDKSYKSDKKTINTEDIFSHYLGNLPEKYTEAHDEAITYMEENGLDLDDQPLVKVNLSDLISTQGIVSTQKVDKIKNEKYHDSKGLWVIKSGGNYFLENGHHRISADILNKKKSQIVHLYDYDKITNSQSLLDKTNSSEKYSDNIGRKLGSGTHNSAFNYNKDENKVVKFGEQIFHHAKIFTQYPNYFPIVYGVNKEDESILIEKLDVYSAEEDMNNEILNNKIYKEISDKDSLGYVDIKILKSQNKFELVKNSLSEKGKVLFNQLFQIYHNTPMRDFKLVNFGYNKEGKLKGLDL